MARIEEGRGGEGRGREGRGDMQMYVWIERKMEAKKKKMILFDCAGRSFSFPPHVYSIEYIGTYRKRRFEALVPWDHVFNLF